LQGIAIVEPVQFQSIINTPLSCVFKFSPARPNTLYLTHITDDQGAILANYEMVTSLLLWFVVQRLKTQKDSLQTDWRPSGLVGKSASWKGGHSWLYCERVIILWLQNNYNMYMYIYNIIYIYIYNYIYMDHARHTPKECMMKPMVLHSNRHLHAVTPAKEEQWRAWNNVNSVSCM